MVFIFVLCFFPVFRVLWFSAVVNHVSMVFIVFSMILHGF